MNNQVSQGKSRWAKIWGGIQKVYYIIFLVSFVSAVIGWFVGGDETRKWLIRPLLNPIIAFILVSLASIMGFIINRISQKTKMLDVIHDQDSEQLSHIPVVRYGHINYPPLLKVDPKSQAPAGIGLTILQMILPTSKISKEKKRLTWDSFEDSLTNEQVDIITTPLFEFSNRLSRISFSSPVFYSEIGLYYSKQNEDLSGIANKKLSIDDAKRRIVQLLNNKKPRIKFIVIKGEISQYLARKYFNLESEDDNLDIRERDELEIAGLVTEIADDKEARLLTFVETYQAETNPNASKVANLLDSKQILYPVAFAMRKELSKLRRFINLKLLQLDISSRYGVLDIIKEELKDKDDYLKSISDYDKEMEYIKKHFIREYDA